MAAKRILIVEDQPNLRQIMAFSLQHAGYEVVEAGDGEEGLQKARAGGIDLLVLDLMLPRRSGLEVCSALKGDPGTRALPILMVTAVAQDTGVPDAHWEEQAGADGYMAKPFKIKDLVKRVREMIGEAGA